MSERLKLQAPPGDAKGWHLRREVSLGDIVGWLVLGAAALAAFFTLEARVRVAERDLVAQGEKLDGMPERVTALETRSITRDSEYNRLIARLNAGFKEMRDGFGRLDDKLDDKADKGLDP